MPKVQENAIPRLTKKQDKAAQLLAEDNLTTEQIAEQINVNPATIYRWQRKEHFRKRVTAVVEAYAARAMGTKMALRHKRIEAYNALIEDLYRVKGDRAGDSSLRSVPGASTGLINRVRFELVTTKDGKKASVPVYEIDRSLLTSIREINEEIARELGHLPNTAPMIFNGVGVSMPANDALISAVCKALGVGITQGSDQDNAPLSDVIDVTPVRPNGHDTGSVPLLP